MGCLNGLVLSMFADGEFPEAEAQQLLAHIVDCGKCRRLVASLQEERRALTHAFQDIDAFSTEYVTAIEVGEQPSRPTSRPTRRLVCELALVLFGLAGSLRAAIAFLTAPMMPSTVSSSIDWLHPLQFSGQLNYLLTSLVYILNEGGPMLTSAFNSLAFAAILALVCFGALALVRRSSLAGALLATLAVIVLSSSPSYAIDVRTTGNYQPVTVAAGETVDDTLIALGDFISVEGTINGDLIALGRRVSVSGLVKGDIISAAKDIEITGTVEGNLFGFAQVLQVRSSLRSLYAFGQTLSLARESAISGDATLFGQTLVVQGRIGRDLTAFAEEMEVRSDVMSDIRFHGNRLIISGPVQIGGNLDAEVQRKENVVVSGTAKVAGNTNIRITPPRVSRYTTAWFYLGQVLRVAAAFLTGLVLFWLVPALGRPDLQDRMALLKAGGIGFLALVATPVAAVLIALTLIGLPIGLALLSLWLLCLYLAKIVMAAFVGRALLPSENTPIAIALLLGLALIIVTINLPYIGGLVNFLLTLLGLGTILMVLYQRRRTPVAV